MVVQPPVQPTVKPIIQPNTLNTPTVNITPTPEKKSKKWIIIVLVLLLLAVTGVAGYFAYQNYQLKTNKETITPKYSPINAKPSPTPITNSTADWKTYTNVEYGFSFDYPSAWGDIVEVEPNYKVNNKTYYAKNLFGEIKKATISELWNSKYGFIIERKYNNYKIRLRISSGSPGCEGPALVTPRHGYIDFEIKENVMSMTLPAFSDSDSLILENAVKDKVDCGVPGNNNIESVLQIADETIKEKITNGQLDTESKENIQILNKVFESIIID